MQRIFYIILAINLLTACQSGRENRTGPIDTGGEDGQIVSTEAIYKAEDREILEKFLDSLAPFQDEPMGLLVARTGKLFLDAPYKAHTLERSPEELVINLRELDCTTYAESCLAIARAVKSDTPSFDRYLQELQLIRYRDGHLEGYPSRLHYFCDWIYNNAQKGLVEECAAEIGGIPVEKEIHFMSAHPENYEQLVNDTTLVEIIREQEGAINRRVIYYIPETRLGEKEQQLQEGDIVGITTDMEGIAVMHVGILVRDGGSVHLMHASLSAGKVVISTETLEEYLLEIKRATGIMVARPI